MGKRISFLVSVVFLLVVTFSFVSADELEGGVGTSIYVGGDSGVSAIDTSNSVLPDSYGDKGNKNRRSGSGSRNNDDDSVIIYDAENDEGDLQVETISLGSDSLVLGSKSSKTGSGINFDSDFVVVLGIISLLELIVLIFLMVLSSIKKNKGSEKDVSEVKEAVEDY
tara:strand:- start:1191 stop:1691 length:501 start_codon:yes stop_codon:yes gene_type:complete